MTRVTAVPDPNIPGLDLHAEALAMAEVVGALEHAREHFAKVRGVFNRQSVALHTSSAERLLAQSAKAATWEKQQATRLVEQYRAEALGALMKAALGVDRTKHIDRMEHIASLQRRREQYRDRVEGRAADAAAYNDKTTAAKVSDRSLIAEVSNGKHKSLSDLARTIGLSVSSASVRVRTLVAKGAIAAADAPWLRNDKDASRAH